VREAWYALAVAFFKLAIKPQTSVLRASDAVAKSLAIVLHMRQQCLGDSKHALATVQTAGLVNKKEGSYSSSSSFLQNRLHFIMCKAKKPTNNKSTNNVM